MWIPPFIWLFIVIGHSIYYSIRYRKDILLKKELEEYCLLAKRERGYIDAVDAFHFAVDTALKQELTDRYIKAYGESPPKLQYKMVVAPWASSLSKEYPKYNSRQKWYDYPICFVLCLFIRLRSSIRKILRESDWHYAYNELKNGYCVSTCPNVDFKKTPIRKKHKTIRTGFLTGVFLKNKKKNDDRFLEFEYEGNTKSITKALLYHKRTVRNWS